MSALPAQFALRTLPLACIALCVLFPDGWLALPADPAAEPVQSLPAVRATHSLLLDGASVDGLLVAVGERGHVLLSDDGGLSWRQTTVPTRARRRASATEP